MEDDPDTREQIFHNTVREYIIFLLLFILLYVTSYAIIGRYRRRDREDYFSSDEDEATVFKISLWLCTFSLAVSVGAALLLPISILSNEILTLYPASYYVQWLNHSLIHGMWNNIFLFSNVSLFAFLPFAYLFTESEGFNGYRKGIISRVYETFVVLILLGIIVFGMTYVISSLIDEEHSNIHTMLNVGNYYLPFLYSCISFFGSLILLLCAPLGFVRLFSVVGDVLVKPKFMRNVDEEYYAARMEEEVIRRRLIQVKETGCCYLAPHPMSPPMPSSYAGLQNGALQAGLGEELMEIRSHRKLLDNQRHTSSLHRNVFYPVAVIVLVIATGVSVMLVIHNGLFLLIGLKSLPLSQESFQVGIKSLYHLGPFGAALEIAMIGYLVATSFVGVYSLPVLKVLRPRVGRTPFTHIVGNCALLLMLSSALPLLARVLGFTNFDLLGDFGKIRWLGSMMVVVLYNIVFAIFASMCLVSKFTATVRSDLWAWLCSWISFEKQEIGCSFSISTNLSSLSPSTSPSKEE